MRPRLTRMTAGLAVGITAAVAAACAAGAYLYSVHHFSALLQASRTTSLAEGELIREALEHQMIENDRSLIGRMVHSFGSQPRVNNLLLLDRFGVVRFSSAPVARDADLRIGSPTCQACHRYPPAQRGSSRVIETRGGTILRTVIPIRNAEACHKCHDPAHRINGIMIFDRDIGEMRAELNRDLRWMVFGSGGLALVLVVLIALVVRVVVLRRLQRFETTARLIVAGDLERRVPTEGSDTISWLAQEFNTMADSVTGLLGEVSSQRERLETVINSIDDGIVVLDGERKIIAANEAFLARTGRSRDQVQGVCCHGESGYCNVHDCPTLACLQTGESQVRICEREGAGGAVTCEEVHASPVRTPSGDAVHVVEVWRDITERRAAEARLAESHRFASLGLLASGFSHELNTPLGTVLACVEGILRNGAADGRADAGNGRVREYAGIAREEVLRCRGITQQFLRLARGQASAVDVVEVEPVVASVARLLAPTASGHQVAIEHVPAANRVCVRADEAQLQQAVINLLVNGIQACRPGGRVRVATGIENGGRPKSGAARAHVFIRISDDGCGIAPDQQKRIFEPFYSLRRGGTGLGLFLSLNFVRAWGGDITVESVAGGGATFSILLPPLTGEVEDHPHL